jgi:hypothetical protein
MPSDRLNWSKNRTRHFSNFNMSFTQILDTRSRFQSHWTFSNKRWSSHTSMLGGSRRGVGVGVRSRTWFWDQSEAYRFKETQMDLELRLIGQIFWWYYYVYPNYYELMNSVINKHKEIPNRRLHLGLMGWSSLGLKFKSWYPFRFKSSSVVF